MSVWDWVYKFRWDAIAARDHERQALSAMYQNSFQLMDSEPDQALMILRKGHDLAVQLNEPWWVLFYDHWELQTLLFYKRDYPAALDLAVRTAVESRKSTYAELPQRICLHEDLINTYLGIDPVGYANLIQQAIDYMATEVTPNLDCQFCLQGLRCDFAIARNLLSEAETEAARLQAMAQSSSGIHYRAIACEFLCDLAYRRDDWDVLLEMATAGQDFAKKMDKPMKIAQFLAWQALALRKVGSEDEARLLYRSVYLYMKKLNAVPDMDYFRALTAYHEAKGDYQLALEVQEAALAALAGKKLSGECQCQLYCCQLKARMGKPITDDIAAAQVLATKLIDPSVFLAKLARIERGDLSEKL